jgi:hypothetical protein
MDIHILQYRFHMPDSTLIRGSTMTEVQDIITTTVPVRTIITTTTVMVLHRTIITVRA